MACLVDKTFNIDHDWIYVIVNTLAGLFVCDTDKYILITNSQLSLSNFGMLQHQCPAPNTMFIYMGHVQPPAGCFH